MTLSKTDRKGQWILSGVLVLAMFVAGIFAFPGVASACIPCDDSYPVECGACHYGSRVCYKCWQEGCYPNPGCQKVCDVWFQPC